MAHLSEESLTIVLSQISKDGQEPASAITAELIETLLSVAQELVGKGVVVEVK